MADFGISDLIICATAFIASLLTLFSGFGLGTILMPAFAIFFPVDVAVAATAVVHFSNNVFKIALVGRHIDWKLAVRFGLPAILAALVGAWLLVSIVNIPPVYQYNLGSKICTIRVANLLIALLLSGFALLDLSPWFQKMQLDAKYLPIGGLLSGFFGGLSGHQGALRSAFMIRAGLSKEAFVATGVIIASAVDVSRLALYAQRMDEVADRINWFSVGFASVAAFAGAYAGARMLKKVTIAAVQRIVAVMLLILSVLLGGGII